MQNISNSKKGTIAAVGIIVVGILLYFVFSPSSSKPKETQEQQQQPKEEKLMSKAEIVTLVSQQSKLYSAEQDAHKTVILSTTERDSINTILGTLKWTRPWSKTHMEIPIDVTYKAYVDLSKIKENDVSVNADTTITITLPSPVIEMTSCEIDHNHEVYDEQIFASSKSQEFVNRHVASAVSDVWREVSQSRKQEILDDAKSSANKAIAEILIQSGYKKVNIKYADNLDINRLRIDVDDAVNQIKY